MRFWKKQVNSYVPGVFQKAELQRHDCSCRDLEHGSFPLPHSVTAEYTREINAVVKRVFRRMMQSSLF